MFLLRPDEAIAEAIVPVASRLSRGTLHAGDHRCAPTRDRFAIVLAKELALEEIVAHAIRGRANSTFIQFVDYFL